MAAGGAQKAPAGAVDKWLEGWRSLGGVWVAGAAAGSPVPGREVIHSSQQVRATETEQKPSLSWAGQSGARCRSARRRRPALRLVGSEVARGEVACGRGHSRGGSGVHVRTLVWHAGGRRRPGTGHAHAAPALLLFLPLTLDGVGEAGAHLGLHAGAGSGGSQPTAAASQERHGGHAAVMQSQPNPRLAW